MIPHTHIAVVGANLSSTTTETVQVLFHQDGTKPGPLHAVGGSWMVPKNLIAQGDFAKIEELCAHAVRQANPHASQEKNEGVL